MYIFTYIFLGGRGVCFVALLSFSFVDLLIYFFFQIDVRQKKSKKKKQLKEGSTAEKEKQPEVLKSKNEHEQLLSNEK